ncbi:putative UNC-like C-terminal-domain-containing protein [Seiridium cardinale]|uniref:UNC-like C-terminal-domain-containing protein n=1 Tax=Seiridium cardinale TaxID=138064 RepID=A0ABR2XFR8_9PEZI
MLFLRNLRLAALLIALSSGRGQAAADSSPPTAVSDATKPKPTTPATQPTCESRTVNYITHTLPQQCLTSSPTPTAATASDPTAVGSPIASSAAEPASSSHPGPATDEHELDGDGNDLSTGAFMSFEEWKEMMLQKSGQENLGNRPRKPHDGRGDAPGEDYGSIGEEGEIALDFDAYSNKISEITSAGKPAQKEKAKAKEDSAVEKVSYDEGLGHVHRSKDAGKTCKERFSYASFDAGATVLKTSPKAQNPKAILVENKDAYMLMECGTENKFFIVELSDDILVDTVVLANFEFFSSMVRQFRVSVSDRYPVKLEKWKVLGEHTARNSRDIQPFLIEHPQIWARYLRIEILSHYGKEFYCPLSLLRVHGTRMLDSWKEADPNDAESELDGDEEIAKSAKSSEEPTDRSEPIEVVVEETQVEEVVQPENKTFDLHQSNVKPFWDPFYFQDHFRPSSTCALDEGPAKPSQTLPTEEEKEGNDAPARPKAAATAEDSREATSSSTREASGKTPAAETGTHATSDLPKEHSSTPSSSNMTSSESVAAPVPLSASGSAQTSFDKPISTISARPTVPQTPKSKPAAASTSLRPPSSKSHSQKVSNGTTSRNKTVTVTSSSASASPTVQDSFFKQLTKRLHNLESNTTLSMQYIESQSKFLQEALTKLERRHAAKVDLFLDSLNKTVMTELREFRSQYDQIWQSTVIALESQREKFEHENVALSTRVGLLADEVVFQKRMAIVQSILLLGCLVLVVFGRGIGNAGLELYYPSQLQGSFSRLASPLYPTTPKGVGRAPTQLRPGPVLGSHEDINGTTPSRGLASDNETSATPPHPRMAQSPSPEPRPQVQRHLSLPENRRPSPSRSVSEVAGLELYQPPTPASLDAGYDSEPPHMPSLPGADYFSTRTNGHHANTRASTSTETTTVPTRNNITPRLPTPVSDVDDHANEDGQSRGVTRMPTSGASSVKPLPALPEEHQD